MQDIGSHNNDYCFKMAGYNILFKTPTKNQNKTISFALAFKNSLTNAIQVKDEKIHPKNERIWAFDILFPRPHSLYVIYNNNKDKSTLSEFLKIKPEPFDIILGDLNSYSSPNLDFCTTSSNPGRNIKYLSALLNNG